MNCLTVYSNTLRDLGTSIAGTVKLVDETGGGAGAHSAVVHARWTRPDGSTLDQYDVIGTRLRAEFRLYTASVPGTYTLTVIDATKPGYTFDANSKLLTSWISVGTPGNIEPVAAANSDVNTGSAPLTVAFDGSGSSDADGTIVAYTWQFGDGGTSTEANPSYTYIIPGAYTATLTVTDDMGATNSHTIAIEVTDAGTGCATNCIRIDQIAMRYKPKNDSLTATVVLLDESDQPISQAYIDLAWTLPDGSTQNQSAKTNKRSKARFSLNSTGPGIYTARVTNISKLNYAFDKDNSNVVNGIIEISQ